MKRSDESFTQILAYWLPEMISAFIIITLPQLVDLYLVASFRSLHASGALEMANNLVHTLIKLSEAIPIAAIAIIGRYNGAGEYKKCGKEFIQIVWTALILGGLQLIIIQFSAAGIYRALHVPADIIPLGAPFLRMRSFSIILAFLAFTIIGFMRALKNTRTPMVITLLGSIVFLIADVLLIQGNWGFPRLHIYGSAVASLLQYATMIAYGGWYLFTQKTYQVYFAKIRSYGPDWKSVSRLLFTGIPIIIDKGSMAIAYVWLSSMLAIYGSNSIAAFGVVKNLERAALLPASAFAQVVTFLVSNHLGAHDSRGARKAIVKILILTTVMVSTTVGSLCFFAPHLVTLFTPSAEVSAFVVPVIRQISILVVFDFLQLILAGALRGAGSVHAVMWTRLISCILFFIPVSVLLVRFSQASVSVTFTLIYGAFYISTGIMGLVFAVIIMQNQWYKKKI